MDVVPQIRHDEIDIVAALLQECETLQRAADRTFAQQRSKLAGNPSMQVHLAQELTESNMDLDLEVGVEEIDGAHVSPMVPPQVGDRLRSRFGAATTLFDGTVRSLPSSREIFVKFDDRSMYTVDFNQVS